jgi:hypothetical protein
LDYDANQKHDAYKDQNFDPDTAGPENRHEHSRTQLCATYLRLPLGLDSSVFGTGPELICHFPMTA